LKEWLQGRFYESTIRAILTPIFGAITLNDLSKKVIREKMSTDNASNKTLTHVQSCFRSALNDAVEGEVLESNPLSGWAYKNSERLKEKESLHTIT